MGCCSNIEKKRKHRKNLDLNDKNIQNFPQNQPFDSFNYHNPQDNLNNYLPVELQNPTNNNEIQKPPPSNKNIAALPKTYLESLYKSYYAAKEYFRFNDLREQEVDAINKCRNIKKCLENDQLINIEIPNKITPDYICGYSPAEKRNKCQTLELLLLNQKEIIKNDMNEYMNNLRKLSNANFLNLKEKAKIKLDNDKKELQKLEKYIKIFKDISQNEWTPIPEYIKTNKEKKTEILNDKIPENTMKIFVGKITYTKSNPVLKLGIEFSKENQKYKELKPKNETNEFNETFEWQFNENEWKNIFKYKLFVVLERSYWVKKNKLKGLCQIDLRNLKNDFCIKGNFKIKMESQKEDKDIEISINVRSPIIDKKYELEPYEVVQITKIFPAFEPEVFASDKPEMMAKKQLTKSQISEAMIEINEVLNSVNKNISVNNKININ